MTLHVEIYSKHTWLIRCKHIATRITCNRRESCTHTHTHTEREGNKLKTSAISTWQFRWGLSHALPEKKIIFFPLFSFTPPLPSLNFHGLESWPLMQSLAAVCVYFKVQLFRQFIHTQKTFCDLSSSSECTFAWIVWKYFSLLPWFSLHISYYIFLCTQMKIV